MGRRREETTGRPCIAQERTHVFFHTFMIFPYESIKQLVNYSANFHLILQEGICGRREKRAEGECRPRQRGSGGGLGFHGLLQAEKRGGHLLNLHPVYSSSYSAIISCRSGYGQDLRRDLRRRLQLRTLDQVKQVCLAKSLWCLP